MVVAVPFVHVVEVPRDEIVDVITVRERFVSATRCVPMVGCVRAAMVSTCAVIRMRPIDGQIVLVHVAAVDVVKMPVMNVVRMSLVTDRLVSAARAVDVAAVVKVF